MYVRICVCMYVCMYACMYVCKYKLYRQYMYNTVYMFIVHLGGLIFDLLHFQQKYPWEFLHSYQKYRKWHKNKLFDPVTVSSLVITFSSIHYRSVHIFFVSQYRLHGYQKKQNFTQIFFREYIFCALCH
jgi:hypothetical protein